MDRLNSLELRLSNERMRLRAAKSANERELRSVWVAQIEREIADERRFLADREPVMSDDEILAALGLTDDEVLAALA